MAAKLSTGARNAILGGSTSFKEAFADGFIKIYSGTPPAAADDAIAGTLLCTISDNAGAGGLDLGAASGGTIPKDSGQVWKGVNAASGTATYFRWVVAGDDGTLSTTQVRLQGTVGTVGADLNLSSVNLTSGADQTIDSGNVTLPTY
jgi:hypothetical protein